jgi:hypothetical protein
MKQANFVERAISNAAASVQMEGFTVVPPIASILRRLSSFIAFKKFCDLIGN